MGQTAYNEPTTSEVVLGELKNTLEDYVDEECADLISNFFYTLLSPIIAAIPDLVEFGTLTPRSLQIQLKSEFEETSKSIELPETVRKKIGDCLNKLVKSGWFEKEVSRAVKLAVLDSLEKLEKYDESEVLLEIFHKSCERDLERTIQAWKTCYSEGIDELIFKLFDAVRPLSKSIEDDFESVATTVLWSFQILSEAYYRKLISFLLDCINILEGGSPKKRVRYIGESHKDFDAYKEKYPKAIVFFDEVINAIRNSIAHADYKIDVENRGIIIKDKGEILFKLTEKDIEAKIEYLIRITKVSIHFYLYGVLYFAEKIDIWSLIENLQTNHT